jgi:hypothetical protein
MSNKLVQEVGIISKWMERWPYNMVMDISDLTNKLATGLENHHNDVDKQSLKLGTKWHVS